MWKQRMKGPVSASPLLIGDTILATNELGTTWAFKANPQKYQQVSKNQLGDFGFASFAASESRLFIRTATGDGASYKETLYCIGK
jgi:hypothetical protein